MLTPAAVWPASRVGLSHPQFKGCLGHDRPRRMTRRRWRTQPGRRVPMTKFSHAAAGLLAAGLTLAAQAAKVPLYDDFSGTEIDRAKWQETEIARYVDEDKGRLFLGRLLLGGNTSDSGLTAENV